MCYQNLPVRTGLGQRMEDHKAEYRAKYGVAPPPVVDRAEYPRRDQSEDRPQPKFLVMYQEEHETDGVRFNAGWWVVRAADRVEWDGPLSAEQATEYALRREKEWA